MTEFGLFYTYGQIACFLADVEEPFNDWTENHSQQGFAYREGSVSFSTLQDSNDCIVRVAVQKTYIFNEDAIRIIQVPFKIGTTGIEIATISEGVPLDIPQGIYNLIFQIFLEEDVEVYSFSFVPTSSPEARIIKKDDAIQISGDLLLDAEPAL